MDGGEKDQIPRKGGAEMEIVHNSHGHPLVFTDGESEENQDEAVVCWGCKDLICGPRFSCFTCKFHLHKSCTKLPLTLRDHPLHPQHPLSFLPCSAYDSIDFECNACRENGNGFVYHCSECRLDLHITCALSNDQEGNIVSETTAKKDRFRFGLKQHDLVSEEELSNPLETNNVYCFGCSESISAPFFSCSRPRCQFRIHKFCANLPKQIKVSFLPHEQSLFLVPKSSRSCEICSQEGISFYVCLKYDLFIHPKCAFSNPMDTMKRVDEKHIQHRSHHHNLTLLEDEKEWESIKNDQPHCRLCMRKLESSPRYSCELCPFILHKSCAELPGQVKSHLHPKHPLILYAMIQSKTITNCGYCDETRNLNFCCLQCGFILDVDCFLYLQDYDHQHNYVRIKTFRKLACDACGEEGYFSPWQCTTCHLMLHKKCVELRRFIKVVRHNHVLKLTYFMRFVHECDRVTCQLCYREINVDYAAYYCHGCNYAVHLSCGEEIGDVVSVEETQENSNTSFVESSLDESRNSVGNQDSILTPFKVGNTHQHELTLYDKDPEDHKYCEACLTLISSPFYSCKNCDFPLHKQCAEMLESYKLELHLHHLHLNEVEEYKFCYYCEKEYNGFLYSCRSEGCPSNIDFHCIKLVGGMKGIDHPCHEHKLFFPNPNIRNMEKCQGCGEHPYLILVCSECKYALGFCCAKLPHRIKHRYDNHFLSLCAKDEDDFGEYYCDICENQRDPKDWYYCCKKCDFFAHIECALGDFPYIKFGTTLMFDFHEHPLTYVEQPTSKPPPICCRCGLHCYSKVLECNQCSFAVHFATSCFDRRALLSSKAVRMPTRR